MQQEVLSFWFREIDPKLWWSAEPGFDELVRQRFLGVIQAAAAGELYEWRTAARGRLAEVIVLDQFSRNVYRGTPQAFAQDPMALAFTVVIIGQDWPALAHHLQFQRLSTFRWFVF